MSSTTAITPQISELVTVDLTSTANGFKDRASDSPGNDEASSQYRYSPLSERGNIRLLRLMPHKDKKARIQCQLFEYPLQELGEGIHLYEALSYVWGPEVDQQSENNQMPKDSQQTKSSQQSVYIDNYKLSVKENLHAALSSLRGRGMERIIWIDAICINQKDANEKGHQVSSMAKVYTGANRVIVWLGEAADNSDQALEIIRAAAEEQHANPPIDETNHQAILTLLDRPWFQRIWVSDR